MLKAQNLERPSQLPNKNDNLLMIIRILKVWREKLSKGQLIGIIKDFGKDEKKSM